MAIEVKAPDVYHCDWVRTVVFLGGVIDQGVAPNWQAEVVKALGSYHDVLVLNPRRESWDSSWKQSIDNEQFFEQVTWELDGQEAASINVYVFAPDEQSALSSKAPITLMELGLFARTSEAMVVCPPGYYRKGNVDIVAKRYNIPVFDNLDQLIEALHQRLGCD